MPSASAPRGARPVHGHECYHCKQWVGEGEAHDCWTTTEAALTKDLSEDLRDAYERLRESASELGEQRIYASHHSIMFARKACYAFVRPKRSFLELVIFLGRAVRAPQITRAVESSRTKVTHVVPVRHRDQVEAPITDWLREAYALQDQPKAKSKPQPKPKSKSRPKPKPKPRLKPKPKLKPKSSSKPKARRSRRFA